MICLYQALSVMHYMLNTFVDFNKDLAPIVWILFATSLKREPFSSPVKFYGYRRNLRWQKQKNSE